MGRVLSETHQIVGIIDWEMTCILPRWDAFQYPKLFINIEPLKEEKSPIPVDCNDEDDYNIILRDRWDALILRYWSNPCGLDKSLNPEPDASTFACPNKLDVEVVHTALRDWTNSAIVARRSSDYSHESIGGANLNINSVLASPERKRKSQKNQERGTLTYRESTTLITHLAAVTMTVKRRMIRIRCTDISWTSMFGSSIMSI